uniref:Uncharacterized protein n=1 Tax=Candidatus Methanogaster sp. ANME-2c ERB4 TaxID=2759911 RepID=A0A7G9Y7G3_9EURY|nr:hypothetical protein CFDKNGMC_00007 [Methanosarcinales archaeon ANME-2c ERB4]
MDACTFKSTSPGYWSFESRVRSSLKDSSYSERLRHGCHPPNVAPTIFKASGNLPTSSMILQAESCSSEIRSAPRSFSSRRSESGIGNGSTSILLSVGMSGKSGKLRLRVVTITAHRSPSGISERIVFESSALSKIKSILR